MSILNIPSPTSPLHSPDCPEPRPSSSVTGPLPVSPSPSVLFLPVPFPTSPFHLLSPNTIHWQMPWGLPSGF